MAKLFNNKKRYKPILKWPKEMRKHLSKLYKNDGQIFNTWSAYLTVREMKNRNKVSFQSFLLALLLQRWQKSSVVRNASRREEICTVGHIATRYCHLEKQCWGPTDQVKLKLPRATVALLFRILPNTLNAPFPL